MHHERPSTESNLSKDILAQLTFNNRLLGALGFIIALGFVYIMIIIALFAIHVSLIASASVIALFGIVLLILGWRITTRER